jgi:hypothetical protein
MLNFLVIETRGGVVDNVESLDSAWKSDRRTLFFCRVAVAPHDSSEFDLESCFAADVALPTAQLERRGFYILPFGAAHIIALGQARSHSR